jgi:hypothetical protein
MSRAKVVFSQRTVPDNTLLNEWHAADVEHQHADASFFTEPRPGVEHFTVKNGDEPMMFVTVENVARVHIQFSPNAPKLKLVKTLLLGLAWLINALKERGYRELIFDSKFPSLIKFCQSALGFQKCDQDYSTRI